MIIFEKQQFNKLVSIIRGELQSNYNFMIKPLKLTESLSRCLGFNSHNHLLACLPVKLPRSSSEINNIDALLTDELRKHFGFTQSLDDFLLHILHLYWNEESCLERAGKELLSLIKNTAIEDFGQIVTVSHNPNKYTFHLNELGFNISSFIDEEFDKNWVDIEDWKQAHKDFNYLLNLNADNYYLNAKYVSIFSDSFFQKKWESFCKDFETPLDKFFIDYVEVNSQLFVDTIIDTFDYLTKFFAGKDLHWSRSYSSIYSSGHPDEYFWEHFLFFGAITLLNAKKHQLARKMFMRYNKVTGKSNRNSCVGSYLSILSLIGLGGKVTTYLKKDDFGTIPELFLSLECYKQNKFDKAVRLMKLAAITSWAVFELFFDATQITQRQSLRIMNSSESIAAIQEVNYRLADFWRLYPNCKQFYVEFFMKDELMKTILEYHLFLSSNVYGAALREKNDDNWQQYINLCEELQIPPRHFISTREKSLISMG